MALPVCPICGTRICIELLFDLCDWFICPSCHQQLEVSRSKPLELMVTSTVYDELDFFFDENNFGENLGQFIEFD